MTKKNSTEENIGLVNFKKQDNTVIFEVPASKYKDVLEKIPEAKEVKGKVDYTHVPQEHHTNKLAYNLNRKVEFDLMGKPTIIKDGFEISFEGVEEIKSNTSAVRFLDMALCYCKTYNTNVFNMKLTEYINLIGKSDRKSVKQKVDKDINAIKCVWIKFKGTKRQSEGVFHIPVAGGTCGRVRGDIKFTFSNEFLTSVPDKRYMYIPSEYYQINDNNNPHTTYFLRKIAEHRRINIGKSTANIIGVKTLIESSPIFPSYEEMEQKKFSERILTPFERDMDSIQKIKWNYCGRNEKLVKPPTTYEEFTNLNVKIEWEYYPDTTNIEEKRSQKKIQK